MSVVKTETSAKPYLSEPLILGDLTLRNRNIMASLMRNRAAPTNVPNDTNLEYYTQRAKGGCGLILSEGTLVSQQGTEFPNAPGIWSEEHVRAWKKIVDSVHESGTYIFCQLWHAGRVAHPDMEEQKLAGKPVPGPSAVAARGGKFRLLPGSPGYVPPTVVENPWSLVREYRHAAEMAKMAGFDGVELHSANGYLVNQFLDASSNRRQDEWGGSVENRCKFGLECFKTLVEIWGPARVGIKINPCGGFNDVGMSLPDTIQTYTYYLTQIASMKPAYVQFVRYVPKLDFFLPMDSNTKQKQDNIHDKPFKRGTPHDVLAVYGGLIKPLPPFLTEHSEATIRGHAMPKPEFDSRNPTPTRVFVNGDLGVDEAEDILALGAADAVVFGKLWIGNPDLQKRIERGMPVNQELDVKTFYYGIDGDIRAGYTTYPEANFGTEL